MKHLILFLLFPLVSFSQETPETAELPARYGVGIVPQYAIVNGIRVDFDFRLNGRGQWLVLAPQAYISSSNNSWDYYNMTGTGIEIQHKLFLNEFKNRGGTYFAYGPVFNYFSVNDDGLVARNFIENGGNYIGLVDDEINTKIFKIGGNVIFGLQLVLNRNFYLDTYVGTGIRFSFDNKTTGLHEYYNDWWGDMGYSGTLIVGGFRFGVLF